MERGAWEGQGCPEGDETDVHLKRAENPRRAVPLYTCDGKSISEVTWWKRPLSFLQDGAFSWPSLLCGNERVSVCVCVRTSIFRTVKVRHCHGGWPMHSHHKCSHAIVHKSILAIVSKTECQSLPIDQPFCSHNSTVRFTSVWSPRIERVMHISIGYNRSYPLQ